MPLAVPVSFPAPALFHPCFSTPAHRLPPSHAHLFPPFPSPAETKGVPMERVPYLFARHRLWRRVMGPAAEEVGQGGCRLRC